MSNVDAIQADTHPKRRSSLRFRQASVYKSPVHLAIQLSVDIAALTIAWYTAIQLRLFLNPYMKIQLVRSQVVDLSPSLIAVLVLWAIALGWLHQLHQLRGTGASFARRSAESGVAITAIIIISSFFSAEFSGPLSRSVVLLLAVVSLAALSIARLPEGILASIAEERLIPIRNVAVVGSAAEADQLVKRMSSDDEARVRIRGLILPSEGKTIAVDNSFRVLGTCDQVAEIINREQLHSIIVINREISSHDDEECGFISRRMGVTYGHAISDLPVTGFRVRLVTRYGMQVLEREPVSFSRKQELFKRIFDICGALVFITILLPVLAVFAVLVRSTSKGAALYRSRRVGKGGRHFLFLKFRSMRDLPKSRENMHALNERSGHIFKIKNDPRVTPVGRFMRRFSIDEAPQLLNVLSGDMSLVGPRPLPADDLDPDGMSKKFSLWADQRAKVPPGVTGLWQIRGRSDLSFEEMMNLDEYYIRHWSILLDLKILLATPLAVLSGRGAY